MGNEAVWNFVTPLSFIESAQLTNISFLPTQYDEKLGIELCFFQS